jgi:hypothetical protein
VQRQETSEEGRTKSVIIFHLPAEPTPLIQSPLNFGMESVFAMQIIINFLNTLSLVTVSTKFFICGIDFCVFHPKGKASPRYN